jgi:hypothetical protein
VSRRLWLLAAGVPAAVLAAAVLPWTAPAAALLIPAASIAWALRGPAGTWAVAMAPGAVAVWATAPDGLAAYLASVLAGPLVARLLGQGQAPSRALAWGAAPLAAWTVAAAASGFSPFPADADAAFDAVWGDARVPPERVEELRASSELALEVLRRTWVASEVVWFWVTLVVAWWFLGRVGLRSGHPGQGGIAQFDVPDAWVAVLIAGLAAVLIGASGPDVLRTVGWNLVLGSGLVFAVRGVGVQVFWMRRAGWSRRARVGVLGLGFVLALPVFSTVAVGLGLFDAWFDFRRIRGSGDGRPEEGTGETR